MRLLLDTHALIWWFEDSRQLPNARREDIADPSNQVLISAVSAFEIALKFNLVKLPTVEALLADFKPLIVQAQFTFLDVTPDHGLAAGALPLFHKDPFDRMLIAQALSEDLTIISNETLFDRFAVRRLW